MSHYWSLEDPNTCQQWHISKNPEKTVLHKIALFSFFELAKSGIQTWVPTGCPFSSLFKVAIIGVHALK